MHHARRHEAFHAKAYEGIIFFFFVTNVSLEIMVVPSVSINSMFLEVCRFIDIPASFYCMSFCLISNVCLVLKVSNL